MCECVCGCVFCNYVRILLQWVKMVYKVEKWTNEWETGEWEENKKNTENSVLIAVAEYKLHEHYNTNIIFEKLSKWRNWD